MSGVANPQYIIRKPFCATGVVPDDATLPLPIPSQQAIKVGAASYDDGFPEACRTPPENGGEPPFEQDMNGLLYSITQYSALMQAGQIVPFNADFAATNNGYRVGALLSSGTVPGRTWTNCLDTNAVDPDTDPTNWRASDPLYATSAPASGIRNNVALPGASNYALDVDTSAGDLTDTGFIARTAGQRVTLTNVGSNRYQLNSSVGGGDQIITEGGDNLVTEGGNSLVTEGTGSGSAAANQIRTPTGGITLLHGMTATIQWILDLQRWIVV